MKVSRQSVQKLTELPVHEAQGETHLWQVPLTLVKPDGHESTQTPSRKIPLAHVQTPLTDRLPVGHVLTHCPFESENPLKQVKQVDRSAEQVLHG